MMLVDWITGWSFCSAVDVSPRKWTRQIPFGDKFIPCVEDASIMKW
jgi:hypothetical protein